MLILQTIFSILSILIIILLFIKPRIGVLLYLVYYFLAPHIIIDNMVLGTRTEALILLTAFLATTYKHTPFSVYKQLKPFFLYYGLQVLLIPFSFDVEFSFNSWFVNTSQLIFVIFLSASICLDKNTKTNNWYMNTFLIIFALIIAYGLFLTTMPGINPYQMILQPIFGGSFNEAYAAGQGGNSDLTILADGRLFGRISSFFSDPQKYALALGFFFIFIFLYVRKKWLLGLFILVIGVAIVTSGVRTPIAALGVSILFLLFYCRKYKYFGYVIIAVLLLSCVVPLISTDTADYISSIVNSDNSETKGSSIEMRLSQLEACMNIMEETPIFGNGINWTSWYIEKHGGHPQALYFESLLFITMCNMGIVGLLLWVVFICSYIKTVSRYIQEKSRRAILYTILIFYLSYTGITGDYGYLPLLAIFYVMITGYSNSVEEANVCR